MKLFLVFRYYGSKHCRSHAINFNKPFEMCSFTIISIIIYEQPKKVELLLERDNRYKVTKLHIAQDNKGAVDELMLSKHDGVSVYTTNIGRTNVILQSFEEGIEKGIFTLSFMFNHFSFVHENCKFSKCSRNLSRMI